MRSDYAERSQTLSAAARPLRRRMAVLGTALALALLVVPAIPATAGGGQTFTFEGGGFGHGVGMSQFGAYGMALEGATWEQIMSHYFTGASPGDVAPGLASEPIWVNLTMEKSALTLTVFGIGAGPHSDATFTLGDQSITAAVGETVTLTQVGATTCRVTAPGGTLEGPCTIDAEWDGWENSPTAGLELGGCELVNWNAPGGSRLQPCRYARGGLRVRPDSSTQTMNLSAEIDMEDYILGISEMPYFWGSTGGMEALEAQAVAARSYAYHRVIQRGDPADRPWCWCHIYDTTVDQYYVGWGHGTQEWVDAVANTDGKIMTHPSETRDGALIPIQTFYSSSTYGVTENSEDGFIAYVPYLRSVDDHWSQDPAVGNHSARWTRTFTGGQLAASLPGMATVTGVEITKCSPSGAALQITFQGQGGPRAYATRELRGRLALKSMQVLAVGAPTPGASPCGDPGADPGTEGGPAALLAISIDDDTVGDSFGNGDGLAQCGETVEVFTTVGTDGDAITGVGMTISSSDPHVTVAWNTTSDAVDIPVGGSATNAGDWDLTIGNGAQDAHEATLVLVVTADNGGPWTLDVPLPISCGRTRGDAAAGLTDVNANGTADVAVALTNSSGRSRVIVKDGATGRRIATTSLGRSTVLHLEPVADLGRSPAPDLAALVVNSRGGRIVILDSATGARVESHSLPRSRSPVDLDVVGDGPNSMLVVTSQSPTRTFVDTYSAVSGDPISSFRIPLRLTVADVEGLRAPDGESVVGVLVAYPGGRTAVLLFDAATGEPAGSVRFSRKGAPVDLEAAVDGAGVRLVTTFMAGPDVVVESRGLSGVRHSVAVVGRGTVVDVESLPNVGGTPTPDIAVLVVDSGIARAIVVDPASGSVIASPSYPAGLDPIDLAVISGGGATRLAVLGNLSRGARVSLSSPTGTGLETISVP